MKKDKKQMLVLGALVLVVLAVGAFQFMGPKTKPVVAKDTTVDKQKDDTLVVVADPAKDPMQDYINSLIANSSTPRDPFQPQAVVIEEPTPDHPVNDPPRPTTNQRPTAEIGGPWKPIDPSAGGNFGEGGFGDPPTNLVPDTGGPTTNGQPFALTSVMIGKSKKLCSLLLRDGQQTLVSEGQSFGRNMETTVVEITEEYVVLRHQGRELKLGLNGGN
jgi:hypothetical protein